MSVKRFLIALPGESSSVRDDALLVALRARFKEAGRKVFALALDPQEDEVSLEEQLQHRLSELGGGQSTAIGGFSLGARIAASLAVKVKPVALVCFGYPAHRRGELKATHGLAHLRSLQLPTLVIQGERDSHGTRAEFRSYPALPPCIQIHWVADANHRFAPRAGSALSQSANLDDAASAALQFLSQL